MSEIRLVPMKVAGKYGKGGLRLIVVVGSHREAWDTGITSEEADEAVGALDVVTGEHALGAMTRVQSAASRKLREAFSQ